jgi:hypothetical protein
MQSGAWDSSDRCRGEMTVGTIEPTLNLGMEEKYRYCDREP